SEVQAGSYPVSLENLVVSDENAGSLIGSGLGAIIEVDSALLSSFDLLLPGSGSVVDVSAANIEFVWNRSTFPANPVINYMVHIGVKNYGELTESYVSGGNGTDTTLFLNIGDLRQAIESQGIPMQNPQEIYWWVVASDVRGSRQSESIFDLAIQGLVGIDRKSAGIPPAYRLFRNYPNPFNSQTTIRFEIPEPATVRITVYNLLGQVVVTLIDNDFMAGGHYSCRWNGLNQNGEPVKSGLYIVSFQAGNYYSTQKIVFLK
ncbi:MAG: T9SS type A sorting domain-containing protein, partial [Candidatus Marinimicrobia bacterium]|nr:T9SS type A sorting domain-containing protein [Candidatus Neomarinimicrobiota bacterium]